MKRGNISKLTETQKICLRHVNEHLTSKDIARILACSPHTVDSHIRTAQKLLDASSRFEAARILASVETGKKRTLSSRHSRLVQPIATAPFKAPQSQTELAHDKRENRTRLLPLPNFWGDNHDLSNAAKLGWMILTAIYICLSIGALLALFDAVNSFYR